MPKGTPQSMTPNEVFDDFAKDIGEKAVDRIVRDGLKKGRSYKEIAELMLDAETTLGDRRFDRIIDSSLRMGRDANATDLLADATYRQAMINGDRHHADFMHQARMELGPDRVTAIVRQVEEDTRRTESFLEKYKAEKAAERAAGRY